MRVLVGTIAAVLACGRAFGQSADPMTTFEVASIKPSAPPTGRGMMVGGNGGPGTKDPTRINYVNMTLSGLVTLAYDLKRYQYTAPSWMETERFDITAKIPAGATREQFREMMQNLLKERFKLEVHREPKEMSGFQLLVAKNGPKFQEAVEEPEPKDSGPDGGGRRGDGPFPKPTMDKEGFPVLPAGRGQMTIMMNGKARMRFSGQTMEQFAGVIGNQISQPVVDATGLKGKFDFEFYWVSDRGLGGAPRPPSGEGGPPVASNPEETGPTIYAALQEQLGLRLESKKVPVSMLVVDRCEKAPTEN